MSGDWGDLTCRPDTSDFLFSRRNGVRSEWLFLQAPIDAHEVAFQQSAHEGGASRGETTLVDRVCLVLLAIRPEDIVIQGIVI